jgi:hypothetical protein
MAVSGLIAIGCCRPQCGPSMLKREALASERIVEREHTK